MSDIDPRTLANGDLEAEVATLSAQLDVAEHRLLALIGELDRCQRHRDHGSAVAGGVAVVARRARSGGGARESAGRQGTRRLPHISTAFSRAEVSYSKVRAMTRVATPTTRRASYIWRRKRAPPSSRRVPRHRAGHRPGRRSADPPGHAAPLQGRHGASRGPPASGRGGPGDEGNRRGGSRGWRRFRGSSDLATRRAPPHRRRLHRWATPGRTPGRRTPPDHRVCAQIIVCVRASELNPGGASAESQAGPVGPKSMRRLACDACASIVTVDDAGSPLDAGKKTRTIAPALRWALVARDGGCRFPGCNSQHWVDAHHIAHWADGGETCGDKLILLCTALLCTAHHRLVHEGSFRMSGTATNPRFERPVGTSIDRPLRQVPHLGLARARPARAPCMARPNYHWAIGVIAPAVRTVVAA